MALGKNLKKKNLIPSPKSKGEVEAVKITKSDTKKSSVNKVDKTSIPSKSKESIEIVENKQKKQADTKQITQREPEFRLLDQQEFDRRMSLHTKFNKEVEALNEKKVHLIIFKIKDEEFAVEIDKIREVVPTPAISKMPQSPSYVPGIATIRGRAIVTIDLKKKFGLSDESVDKEHFPFTMIVSTQRFTVGILIDEVPINLIVDGSNIQSTAQDMSETTVDETYVKGMLKHDGRVIFLMDIDELVEGDRLKNRLGTGLKFGS